MSVRERACCRATAMHRYVLFERCSRGQQNSGALESLYAILGVPSAHGWCSFAWYQRFSAPRSPSLRRATRYGYRSVLALVSGTFVVQPQSATMAPESLGKGTANPCVASR